MMEATFNPDANPYKNTGESYEEYIARMEKIIYRWHDKHTTMTYQLKQLLKHEVFDNESSNTYEHLMDVFNRFAEIIHYDT